jgi:hypothetical protein
MTPFTATRPDRRGDIPTLSERLAYLDRILAAHSLLNLKQRIAAQEKKDGALGA